MCRNIPVRPGTRADLHRRAGRELHKSLKRQSFFAPLALWYLKHCNYEKLKPKLIRLGMSHLRGEGPEEAAYAQDMFESIFRDYRQEKDDYFSKKMQRDLIRLMHEPRIAYVSGGHLTTVLQAEKFIETIRGVPAVTGE